MDGFEETYRHHFGAVFRFAIHCLGKRELAEDLTSEAFLELYRNWDKIDQKRLPGWLIAVVKNRAVDHWRRASREELYAEAPVEARTEFDSRLGIFLEENKALVMAALPGNAVLHPFSTSQPSRAGVYARASARIPFAEQGGVRDLELGKAVETVAGHLPASVLKESQVAQIPHCSGRPFSE
jgi:RNA polymerase sigma factor (sigma-70 family)